ncbi:hypothetical protein AB0H82_01465 [Streptomyces sp. NPDC050732]|uniref:hypothetical protein n=1 Tax=Streptomyces sp. NPDC050732 TaxID=3154632 RepID=UPI00344A0C44
MKTSTKMSAKKDLLVLTVTYLALVAVAWAVMDWNTARWMLLLLPVLLAARALTLRGRGSHHTPR